MVEEVWKPIPGYDNYEASDEGRIRSVDRWIVYNKTGARHFYKGQILKIQKGAAGYPAVSVGHRKTALIHKLVALAFFGPCPEGHEVCHNDGNINNRRKGNLRYGTFSSNKLDMVRHGTAWWLRERDWRGRNVKKTG